MKRVSSRSLLFLTCMSCGALVPAQESATLRVMAATPVVDIEIRTVEQKFIQMPSLSYALEISKECQAGLAPSALSLSTADTRRSLDATEISETEKLTVNMTVPEGQIGPVAIETFCMPSKVDGLTENELHEIPGVLSLQAALLCTNESESEITYASTSLDVTLRCTQPVADATTEGE